MTKKFQEFGIPKPTAYRYYAQLVKNGGKIPERRMGRPKIVIDSTKRRRLVEMTECRIFPGFRAISRMVGCHKNTAKNVLQENGIKVSVRRRVPEMTADQINRQKNRLPKLLKAMRGHVVIMDFETYFDLEGHNFYGGQFYSTTGNPDEVLTEIRYRQKPKFSKKLLLWVAISSQGISKPYFHLAKEAVNAQVYAKNCIKNNLMEFFERHGKKKFLFWPDLASAHCGKFTLDAYKALGINYLPKESNPPVVPMLRQIETFFAHLKATVYANGFKAETAQELKRRIQTELRHFDSAYFQRLMKNLRPKIEQAIESCPLSVIDHKDN